MSDETLEQKAAREAAEAKAAEDAAKAKAQVGDKVELEADVYDALLSRLEQLEAESIQHETPRKGVKTVDDLADEIERPNARKESHAQQVGPDQINQMSNIEFGRFMLNEIHTSFFQPILVQLEQMRVTSEVEKLRTELGDEDDFEELQDQIYKVAVKNPTLSIKEAYHLAKKSQPAKGDKKGENASDDGTPRRGLLLRLPPRVYSERSTQARSASDKGPPETRMDAAKNALDDLEKSGQLKF